MKLYLERIAVVLGLLLLVSCGSDADDVLIGAECAATNACENDELTCLMNFKGGYCGASGCTSNDDCPDLSICVTEAGTNYCFRTCSDKAECNENRTADNESNCSSSVDRVDGGNQKACVPPSA